MNLLSEIEKKSKTGRKMLGVLIDPDKSDAKTCELLVEQATKAEVDFFFYGSSLLMGNDFERGISILKQGSIPLILFPGNGMQISDEADAILFLSLISGRNPDMLIGRHVLAAPHLKKTKLEIIPTGYMLIDSGAPTSVSYMSGTIPVPHDKPDIAACTAMAGEMLGLRLMYLEAGSGARYTVSTEMIKEVKSNINVPLIVGGGIRNPEKSYEICRAGADMIMVGNVLEKNPLLLSEISAAVHSLQAI